MAKSLAHSKCMCKYHIKLSPGHRRKIICNQLSADIQQYIRGLFKWKGAELLEGQMIPGHMQLLLSLPPKYCVSSFMRCLKDKSAMLIFEGYGNLKCKLGSGHFWAAGYYVSAVGLNEASIKKYIREQDILEDNDCQRIQRPFQGQPVVSPLRPHIVKASAFRCRSSLCSFRAPSCHPLYGWS